MATIAITSEVFRWARERAGLSDERLAKSVHTKPEKIRAWEAGLDSPNFQQAQNLASALGIPLGYLFLSQPPAINIPIADFRTLPGKETKAISLNLQDVLDDALRKRDWYKEWRKRENFDPYEFVGKYSLQTPTSEIVQDIRRVLDLPQGFTRGIKSWDDHLRLFVQKIEAAGILVLQSGVVGNNTHRKLSVSEFRGFTLADPFAPVIFVNAQDAIAARIFTLAHEIAHLWIGTSGISNPEILPDFGEVPQIEELCNQVAGEFLVPAEMLKQHWNKNIEIVENAQTLARFFRVSAQVVLRRSYDLDIIPTEDFFKSFEDVVRASKTTTKGGGGDFYNSLISRNSRRFTREIVSAVYSGQISYLYAARLLNTQPGKIVKVMEKLG